MASIPSPIPLPLASFLEVRSCSSVTGLKSSATTAVQAFLSQIYFVRAAAAVLFRYESSYGYESVGIVHFPSHIPKYDTCLERTSHGYAKRLVAVKVHTILQIRHKILFQASSMNGTNKPKGQAKSMFQCGPPERNIDNGAFKGVLEDEIDTSSGK